MRAIVFGVVLSLSALVAGSGVAVASKCDSGIEKAAGKKVACICGFIAKGGVTLLGAEDACRKKFTKACAKAKAKGDCVVQTGTCSDKESEAFNAAVTVCTHSPSGAFLD